jgi:hypothetical protein
VLEDPPLPVPDLSSSSDAASDATEWDFHLFTPGFLGPLTPDTPDSLASPILTAEPSPPRSPSPLPSSTDSSPSPSPSSPPPPPPVSIQFFSAFGQSFGMFRFHGCVYEEPVPKPRPKRKCKRRSKPANGKRRRSARLRGSGLGTISLDGPLFVPDDLSVFRVTRSFQWIRSR